MFLSIIVPVYNVEKYLNDCLDSIVTQDFDDFEIICVNDGSTDNCATILEGYAAKYPMIKVIHQKNNGVSSARNTGFKNAKGDWVWFVDSDDFIKDGAIKTLYYWASNSIDIVSFNVELIFEDSPEKNHLMNSFPREMQCTGKEYLGLAKFHEAFSVVWQRIYRTAFLKENELTFHEGIIHEDIPFSSFSCTLAKKVFITQKVLYVYRRRSGSIVTKQGQAEKHALSMATIGNEMFQFYQTHSETGVSEVNKRGVASVYRRAYFYSDSATTDKKLKKAINRSHFRKSSMISLKHYLAYCTIEICPVLYKKIFQRKLH